MEDIKIKDVQFDDEQNEAVALCVDLDHRLVAVSGAAGTGKTTIIRQAYDTLVKQGISVALAAPTGKAARRIKEATGINAVTLHKLLEYNRPGERDQKTGEPLDTTKPKRDRLNPLNYKVVIVDEYAMLNYELHDNLMAAMPSGGCVRAFGDVHQLPPINLHGNNVYDSRKQGDTQTPFQKLLARKGDSVQLNTIYRQEEGSTILENANRIRKGHSVPINQDQGDFYIRVTGQPIKLLKDEVSKNLEAGIDFRLIENQIITPSRKSWVGTKQLNEVLRNLLNPSPLHTLELPRHEWDKKDRCTVGLGDKVVCTSNTYDLRDFFERYAQWDDDMKPIIHSYIPCPDTKMMLNGETGIITQIYPDGAIDVDFGDRIVEIPEKMSEYWAKKDTVIDTYPLRDLDLAFALTTHKCQGSEFQQVIYVMNSTMFYTLSRQNFYTAVTRARNRVMIITDQKSIQVSLRKVKT